MYLRALARDLSEELGVGGYLTALERTRVGEFTLADARTLDAFAQWWGQRAVGTPVRGPRVGVLPWRKGRTQ